MHCYFCDRATRYEICVDCQSDPARASRDRTARLAGIERARQALRDMFIDLMALEPTMPMTRREDWPAKHYRKEP